ncbi:4Fe-4S dicluster domain-containing protein [Bacillus sp. B15-48]|uniref:4Fe-4S dicluster domain-containing protein n=1 Tax=Bacillus sp. B15-48 TaxID=1548601 RepID=UPI00193F558F|nr:4Fe-4S dicluster domain-containing protein [Bacillus sp. B15-48]MBM4765283.1 4Fe-4S ferredoxin [Bacillus sp. B15-48]
MGQKGFYFDVSSCIGCRTCEIACNDKNDLTAGVTFRQVSTYETGIYPNLNIYHYSASCNHCSEAKCIEGCPTGAMHRGDDGTVQHDASKCFGCKYCTWNCPYSVPKYNEDEKKIGKCNSCIDLRDVGENPACVDACVMRCLKFGDLDELEKEYDGDLVSEIPILPSASVTTPSLLIKPKNCALESNYKKRDV